MSAGVFVKNLQLRNFRSVRFANLSFDNPLFLVGRNGSGKSNDVHCLFGGNNAQVYWHDPVSNQNICYWDSRVPRFGPGRSYWVHINNYPANVFLSGAQAFQKSEHHLPVRLQPGVNAIGTPGLSFMQWNPDNVWVSAPDQNGVGVTVTLTEAQNRGWISGSGGDLFLNDPNTGAWFPVYNWEYLNPGEGYYMWSNIECNLLLPSN